MGRGSGVRGANFGSAINGYDQLGQLTNAVKFEAGGLTNLNNSFTGRRTRWSEPELVERRKSDPAKLALAARLRRETTLTVGWIYKDVDGNVVRYPGGYPDFAEGGFVRQNIDIDMVPNRTTDYVAADAAAPLGPKLPENTWHHHQNLTTMQEVDGVVHGRFTHRGAVSISKKRRLQ